jgi:hypothetical protein
MAAFDEQEQTRRTFVKTVSYVAPAILTLKATVARAHQGSHDHHDESGTSAANSGTSAPK